MPDVMAQGQNKETRNKDDLRKWFSTIKDKFSPQEEEREDILKMLQEAHEEWRNAEMYFQSVTEPDLIDYAIYKMEAARRKYIYILNTVRKEGIKVDMQK